MRNGTKQRKSTKPAGRQDGADRATAVIQETATSQHAAFDPRACRWLVAHAWALPRKIHTTRRSTQGRTFHSLLRQKLAQPAAKSSELLLPAALCACSRRLAFSQLVSRFHLQFGLRVLCIMQNRKIKLRRDIMQVIHMDPCVSGHGSNLKIAEPTMAMNFPSLHHEGLVPPECVLASRPVVRRGHRCHR